MKTRLVREDDYVILATSIGDEWFRTDQFVDLDDWRCPFFLVRYQTSNFSTL